VRSVAKRFALTGIAAELASEAEITGWAPGEATEACFSIFRAWLADRGTTGAREDAQAVAQLRDFINRHQDSRFAEWKRADAQTDDNEAEETPPHERFRTINKAGWRRWATDLLGRGSYTYFLTPDAMKEALTGLDFRSSIKALADRGFIQRDKEGKSSVSRRPPGVEESMRLFEVRSSIMGAGDDAGE